jgi:hypothetical protein
MDKKTKFLMAFARLASAHIGITHEDTDAVALADAIDIAIILLPAAAGVAEVCAAAEAELREMNSPDYDALRINDEHRMSA